MHDNVLTPRAPQGDRASQVDSWETKVNMHLMPRYIEAAKGSCYAAGLKKAKVRGARAWYSRAQTGRIAPGV
jgi:hypothetical protein